MTDHENLLADDELDDDDWLIVGPSDAEWLELPDDEWADDGTTDAYLGGIGHEIEDE